ncbi:bacterio-opsin activator domain-containing protein [Halorarius halobius]|uniref:bacterio-opsin activator domain-containing protein n=1 Tax=Halorarius halobius TaxID=2962671 RepID=UPI0020CEAD75|nr:bacterio-opsin activator domain-containing protein [Halorarius halobius]
MSSSAATWDGTRVLVVGAADWVDPLADALRTRTAATVETVRRYGAARETVRQRAVDCVVTAHDLGETTGVELCRALREAAPGLPVVLCTAAGSEAVASDAIEAGVNDYVPLSSADPALDDLLDRIGRAVAAANRTATRRDRARQFDAIFEDARTATWVLDPDGSLARANRTAADLASVDAEAVRGDPFWTLPCWTDAGVGGDVRRVTERALDGSFSSAVVTGPPTTDADRVLELSARPVRDARDTIVSIVVEGVDITDRVSLERELRRSEELHRVTLNNMTDTVLITDDAGEYTYVCPNVHFIFGYTADEIRERGTIDDLLGPDLFDREELAESGVLKNIECTATDKAGREHTLLVNVREVSIQGGTLLYSCRDITKRKQREEALATLQETARDFLYAETRHEIAQHVVEDTPGVLDLDASAVYLFDEDGTDLRPVATAPEMERLHGPLPTVDADGGSLPGYSFIEDESLFLDDVHDADRLANPATDVRSAAYIPLGDHGVFVAGSADVGRFDPVTRELADLLAATAEAALDRVVRESRLREQDRELQAQNAQLSALNRVNEIIREIDQALVRAETREEIDRAVCERLTASDRFAFAWIGVVDAAGETVEPRAWAGNEQGYLDSLTVEMGGAEPAGRTAATGEVTEVTNVADALREASWRKHALSRDYLSALSVPIAYDELTYGVLTVYADVQDAFDDTSQSVLAELGETVASATSAIERKNALLTTATTRLEFEVADPAFVLSRLATAADCTLSYQGGVQQTADGLYVFVTVDGAAVEAVEAAARELVAVEAVQRIGTEDSEGVVRLHLSQPFVALELADHGAVLRSATADPATTTLVVDIPDSVDVRHITQLVTDAFAETELRSKRTLDRASTPDLHAEVFDRLTDRQLEVVQTAYYSGFFESPRESTGEEIADALDISPTAFYQHVRTVQRKLFTVLFEELGAPASLGVPSPADGE